jgi:hypothetical protein
MSSAIIVIPCYNEAGRLPVHTFQTFTCVCRVIVMMRQPFADTDPLDVSQTGS